MRLNINLASQPYEDVRQFWTYWGTGLGLLGLITIVLLYFAIAGFREASADRQQINKLQSQLAAFDH